MAKQLDFVKLLIEGTQAGPVTAQFVYRVYEDSDPTLSKTTHLEVAVPDFSDSVEDFFNDNVIIIKANEGIS